MAISEDDISSIKTAFKDALAEQRSDRVCPIGWTGLAKEELKEAVRDAMREKLEMTLGIDCSSPEDRLETRKDMEFLRAMRLQVRSGAERALLWVLGVAGMGALAWFWPDIHQKLK